MRRDPRRRAKRHELRRQMKANDERIAALEARAKELDAQLLVTTLAINFLEGMEAWIRRTTDCEIRHPDAEHCTCCLRTGLPLVVVPEPGSLSTENPWDVCEDCIGHVRARCGIKGTEHDDEDGYLCRFMPESAICKPQEP